MKNIKLFDGDNETQVNTDGQKDGDDHFEENNNGEDEKNYGDACRNE